MATYHLVRQEGFRPPAGPIPAVCRRSDSDADGQSGLPLEKEPWLRPDLPSATDWESMRLFRRSRSNRTCPQQTGTPDAPRKAREARLTHVDASGAARMVDISTKIQTARSAVATGALITTVEVIALLQSGRLTKGDALATARIAAIMGAKRTADLVPLCHPIALTAVSVDLDVNESTIFIRAETKTTGSTGVEMEALTAVAVAGLALHDMIKAVDPAAVLTDVGVQRKDGGKTGVWVRPPGRPMLAVSGREGTDTPGSRDPVRTQDSSH